MLFGVAVQSQFFCSVSLIGVKMQPVVQICNAEIRFKSTRLRVAITVFGCSIFLSAAIRAVRRNAEETEESAVH